MARSSVQRKSVWWPLLSLPCPLVACTVNPVSSSGPHWSPKGCGRKGAAMIRCLKFLPCKKARNKPEVFSQRVTGRKLSIKLWATCKRTGNGSFVSQFFAQWFFYPAAGSENKTETKQTKNQQGIVLHIHYMLRARNLQVFSNHVGSDIKEF